MQSFGICNIVANTVSLINKGKLLVLCLSVHFLPHSWVQPRCMYYTVTLGYCFSFRPVKFYHWSAILFDSFFLHKCLWPHAQFTCAPVGTGFANFPGLGLTQPILTLQRNEVLYSVGKNPQHLSQMPEWQKRTMLYQQCFLYMHLWLIVYHVSCVFFYLAGRAAQFTQVLIMWFLTPQLGVILTQNEHLGFGWPYI